MAGKGKVYLVGAGPGDPGLLTLRGARCLEEADVVLYDALVHERLLEYAPGAEQIFVGKRAGQVSHTQEQIEEVMIRKASEGKQVVRLKGGDPFVFGRGAEEVERCAEAGIPFEVVPGVSAALGVPAYAGIPLTHRDLSSSVTMVTAHEARGKADPIPWREFAKSDTLVVFMGGGQAGEVAKRLLEGGKSPETPVALIRWGTRVEQETMVESLRTLSERVEDAQFLPPTLIVVGEVVSLRPKLQWYERKPLFGKRVLVTRPRHQAGDLAEELERFGAEAVLLPTLEIEPPESYERLDRALDRLGEYDWLIFTSVNGVDHFTRRLVLRGYDLRDLRGIKIAVIGAETERRLAGLHLKVDLVPEEFRSEGILVALGGSAVAGKRFLIPRAKEAREVLPETLRRMGAHVDVVETYRSARPKSIDRSVLRLIEEGKIHWVTFTSSSTVKNFFSLLPRHLLGRVREMGIACIGPVTAATVRARGFEPSVVPDRYTAHSLAQAIALASQAGKAP